MTCNNDILAEKLSQIEISTPNKGKSKRDWLLSNEITIQSQWKQHNVFESDANDSRPKFFLTFPYPYSNGNLHLGHAFSFSKTLFRAQFERHLGKNVLLPFAFHCTGMPIQAAANKLKLELAEFGYPPKFPEDFIDELPNEIQESKNNDNNVDIVKKLEKGSKSKLISKTGTGLVRQWNILKIMVNEQHIHNFIDPLHWLHYFPPIGIDHLKKFGSCIDWRRSFITTSINLYYDAFIRWQFYVLREKNKVLFGKRNNIYSIIDEQVCADHDRSEGEGVIPQEYVLIKVKLVTENNDIDPVKYSKLTSLIREHEKNVYFVPATLRPETMYGQTNCFLLPTGEYGAYYIDALDEIFIMSARSARNFSCQLFKKDVYFMNEFGNTKCLETFKGMELLGLPITAPLSTYDIIYTLPLLTINMNKGTGVVTSVPSDAPDDYLALQVLKNKPDFAAMFNITSDMIHPYEPVPIINIAGYGNMSAITICEKLKIRSFNEKEKLRQAKDETYLKGFTIGIMIIGPHKGKSVKEVKPIIKQEIIDRGQAVLYFEPESRVISRTNDECVVAATDQWYLSYGEESWSLAVKKHVLDRDTFNAYDASAIDKYEYAIDWLKEWACTRQFGLGTNLPWDPKWVIESLSDSTIYMAYYTIAHLLQGEDNLNGNQSKSPNKINPSDLTHDVFDYIYRKGPVPENCNISIDILNQCKQEFRYWYPMDLRSSAKDLITNHLTMALYNHAAIWDDEPELWPLSYYTNGHILVDKEKMSKSKGNFLMLDDTIDMYSADATRFALADAGDSLNDANFNRETANASIISLCNEYAWIQTIMDSTEIMRTGSENLFFLDRVLLNEINHFIQGTTENYSNMQFREGIQLGWFGMLLARNEYRSWCHDSNISFHKDIILKWCESLIIMICPVCPHWSEAVWKLLGKTGFVINASWPVADEEDKLLTRQFQFLRDSLKMFRSQVSKAKKEWNDATILITDSLPKWKIDTLVWLQSQYDTTFPPDLMKKLKTWTKTLSDKKVIKNIMQFVSHVKKEADDIGEIAMETTLPFVQKSILVESILYIQAQLNIKYISIIKIDDSDESLSISDCTKEKVVPGQPYLWLH